MAKKKKGKKTGTENHVTRRSKRDNRIPKKYHKRKPVLRPSVYSEPLYDRRRFEPVEIAYDKTGRPVEYGLTEPQKGTKKKDATKWRIGFKNPIKSMICIRRRKRRRTLFKIKFAGKGKGGPKRRKMGPFSHLRC